MHFSQLDKEKVYQALLRVPLVSMHLNHKHIKSSVRDYVNPNSEQLEAQFVRDLFVLTTDEIIDKWYDGKDSATDLIFNMKNIGDDEKEDD